MDSEIKNDVIPSKRKRRNFTFLMFFTFIIGVLLIFYSYAWFYASLDVKIKFFNMVVTNENGLSISFDGINFDQSIEISEDILINNLKKTYPNNTSQWASMGIRPVSTNGIVNSNSSKFLMFRSNGISYKDKRMIDSYLTTSIIEENEINDSSNFIAFDIFLKNITGSPISDDIYLDKETGIYVDNPSEEMQGLINSMRIGFVRVGTVPLNSDVNSIQNMECNNNCEIAIYEPNSTTHTALSSERAKLYAVNLINGRYFPTYAVTKPMENVDITDGIYGGKVDNEYFTLQKTQTDFRKPLFELPDGISKYRVYVWIEGQDIDSLETRSDGAEISIKIDFIKDTAGYDYYDYN